MSFVLKTDAKSFRPRSRPRPKTTVEPKPEVKPESIEPVIEEEEIIKPQKVIPPRKVKEEKLEEQERLKEQYEKRISELEKEMKEWNANDAVKMRLDRLANRMPVAALLNRYPINKGLVYHDKFEDEEDIHVHIGKYTEEDNRHPKGLYKVSWLYHYAAPEGKMVPSDIMDKESYEVYSYYYGYNPGWFEKHTNKWIEYQKELEQIAEREWDYTFTETPKWDWIYQRMREYIRKYIYKANQIAVLKGLCLPRRTYQEAHDYDRTMFDSDDIEYDYKGYGASTFQFILDKDWLDEYYGDIE